MKSIYESVVLIASFVIFASIRFEAVLSLEDKNADTINAYRDDRVAVQNKGLR